MVVPSKTVTKMYGLVIPSLMQKRMDENARNLRELSNYGEENGLLKSLGNGLGVDRYGNVVVMPRKSLPSQMEAEDLQASLQKIADQLRAITGRDVISKSAYGDDPEPAGIVTKATDPLMFPDPPYTPGDYLTEFGTPIDTTEIIALCEELGVYNALPEVVNGAQIDSWREMTALEFTSGTNWVAFEPGGCPEETYHSTTTRTVTKRHIGAKKTLSESDIVASMASIAAGYGVRELVGAIPAQTAFAEGVASFTRQSIASLKEKEIRAQMVLVLNGWDELLVKGSNNANTEEFDGIETIVTAANGARANNNGAYSGTFNVTRFDEFLAAGCARPTHLYGHQTSLQALKLAYWQLGSSPQARLNFDGPGSAIVPGFTFAQKIQTSVGDLPLVPDSRFSRTDNGDGTFSAKIYGLRMAQNGEPLVYKCTQIPLSYKDLVPGCSAISFETWAVTALTIKHMCAHFVYNAKFSGLVDNGCSYIFG